MPWTREVNDDGKHTVTWQPGALGALFIMWCFAAGFVWTLSTLWRFAGG